MTEHHRRSFRLANQLSRKIAREPSLSYSAFAAHAAMALIVIAFLALTFATMEKFLSGDESLSALEAAAASSMWSRPAVHTKDSEMQSFGYLAWRGLIPEDEMPPAARKMLHGDFGFANNNGSHIGVRSRASLFCPWAWLLA
jgi:hypothetical protein